MADDLMAGVSALLADPEMPEKLRGVAAGLFSDPSAGAGALSGGEAAKMVETVSGLMKAGSRETALLAALEPYLRPSRAAKVHEAIKAVRLISLLNGLRGSEET